MAIEIVETATVDVADALTHWIFVQWSSLCSVAFGVHVLFLRVAHMLPLWVYYLGIVCAALCVVILSTMPVVPLTRESLEARKKVA